VCISRNNNFPHTFIVVSGIFACFITFNWSGMFPMVQHWGISILTRILLRFWGLVWLLWSDFIITLFRHVNTMNSVMPKPRFTFGVTEGNLIATISIASTCTSYIWFESRISVASLRYSMGCEKIPSSSSWSIIYNHPITQHSILNKLRSWYRVLT